MTVDLDLDTMCQSNPKHTMPPTARVASGERISGGIGDAVT